jgi:hypothetical protein
MTNIQKFRKWAKGYGLFKSGRYSFEEKSIAQTAFIAGLGAQLLQQGGATISKMEKVEPVACKEYCKK